MTAFLSAQVFEAYRLPEAGQDVPDDFHEWAEAVALDFESGRDETLIVNNRDGTRYTAEPGQWIVRTSRRPKVFDVYPDASFRKLFREAPPDAIQD